MTQETKKPTETKLRVVWRCGNCGKRSKTHRVMDEERGLAYYQSNCCDADLRVHKEPWTPPHKKP